MELKDYIAIELIGQERNMSRVLDNLTQQEIAWRPSCACNSIGLILFHVARADDSFLLAKVMGQRELWESEKWCEKLCLPFSESGSQYSAEQVNAFSPPPLKDLMAYSRAVRSRIATSIKDMKSDQFDKKITLPFFGDMTIAAVVAIMIDHASQHIGEMSYLRGLQRGINK